MMMMMLMIKASILDMVMHDWADHVHDDDDADDADDQGFNT